MAGTIPLEQLFLDKFAAFNLDRYSDDPEMLPLFQNLTLADIAITDLTPGVPEAQTATVSSVSRNFSGIQQGWLPAVLASIKPFTLMNPGAPLATVAVLLDQTVPGVYTYMDGGKEVPGIVLPNDTTTENKEERVKTLFQASFKYIIADTELSIGENLLTISTNAFVRGQLPFVNGKAAVIVIPPTDYDRLEWPDE